MMRRALFILGFTLASVGCAPNTAPETAPQLESADLALAKILPAIPPEGEIYLNQIGFEPNGPKIALMQSTAERPQIWSLLKGNVTILQGKTEPLGHSPQAGQSLHRIDFSTFITAGDNFALQVGDYKSPPFEINTALYAEMKKDALSYFYHNRSAEPILARYVGAAHARPAGHPSENASCISGDDLWGTNWNGCDYTLDVTGGWYDAGDHGKYVVNSGISVWTLLNAYESFKPAFKDGSANIPEAGNGVNDLLDEARQNIEFMLAMQVPEGQTVMSAQPGLQDKNKPLKTQSIDASGLVHHKVHSKTWPTDAVMAHEFTKPRFLYPPSTGATLNLAAVGAYCARLWREIDDDFSAHCLTAAERAWRAAERHPDIYGYNNFDGGGPYGDKGFTDEFYWAAQELALTTGKPEYKSAVTRYKSALKPQRQAAQAGFNTTALLGILASKDRASILNAADLILADSPKEPFAIPYYKASYKWGSNSELANRAIILGHAYMMTREVKYRHGVIHLMDYILGRNPLGQSYISGYGTRQFFNPHHRHWAASIREGAPSVPAGVLSGGPNDDNMSDPIAKTQIGSCAAQSCWTDHYSAWTQNEVTINWNAPLVWMTIFLDAPQK